MRGGRLEAQIVLFTEAEKVDILNENRVKKIGPEHQMTNPRRTRSCDSSSVTSWPCNDGGENKPLSGCESEPSPAATLAPSDTYPSLQRVNANAAHECEPSDHDSASADWRRTKKDRTIPYRNTRTRQLARAPMRATRWRPCRPRATPEASRPTSPCRKWGFGPEGEKNASRQGRFRTAVMKPPPPAAGVKP